MVGSVGERVGKSRGGGWVDAGGLIREGDGCVGRTDWTGIGGVLVEASASVSRGLGVEFVLLYALGLGAVA